MADQYLKNPLRVNVGSLDLQACHSVTQLIEFIQSENKQARVTSSFLFLIPFYIYFFDSYCV